MKETLLALPEPKARREQVIPFYKAAARGGLVRRVRSDGSFLDRSTLLVTGAYLDSGLVDSNGVKFVHVRELVERDGELAIAANDVPLNYDPQLRVIRIGRIDYKKPENKEFFALLEGNRF